MTSEGAPRARRTAAVALLGVGALTGFGVLYLRARSATQRAQERAETSLALERQARRELSASREREALALARAALARATAPGEGVEALEDAVDAVGSFRALGRPIPTEAQRALSSALALTARSLPLRGHTDRVVAVAFTPEGRQVVTASEDGTARVWDPATGQALTVLRGAGGALTTLALSPVGGRAVTTSRDGKARVWDLNTGGAVATLDAHASEMVGACFAPDGARVATTSTDGVARLWEVASGRCLATLASPAGQSPQVGFLADGRWVVLSGDGVVRFADRAGQVTATVPAPAREFALAVTAPDLRVVLFAGVEEHAGIFALDTGRLVVRLVDARMDIHQASFSREGRRLLVVWGEQGVETVDAVTGRTLAALSGAEEGIADVDFAPGGERVAAGLLDGTLVVWEAATGERVASLTRAEGTVTSVVFSSDGSHLATGTESGVARIWSVAPPCPAPDFDEALRRACAILRWTEAWERRSQLRTHCPAPH